MAVADAHTVSSVLSEAIPKHGAERATILRDALAAARAISDNENRARALGELAPLLPEAERESVLHDALTAARAISDNALLSEFPPLLPEVEDEPESVRARALGELAPLFPEVERESVLHDALIAARAISNDFQRARLGRARPVPPGGRARKRPA